MQPCTLVERQEVQAVYQIDTTLVPPHLSNKRKLLEPIIVPLTKNFHEVLLIELKQMQAEQRPTLVLFETIQDTEEFCAFLQSKQMLHQLINEKQSEHEDVVIARAGDPGMITVATNTAGRGTDIILHPASLENGGLHAIFTFYPENERVQAQGIGRAGRQGQAGSARLILPFSDDAVLEQVKMQGINFFAMPASKQIEMLRIAREEKIKLVSKHRKERAEMETISHRYLQSFFNQLQTYYEQIDEEFLQQFANAWQQKVKKIDLSKISLKPTSKLQEAFLQHAKAVETTSDHWMTFLQMAKTQLVEDVQQVWARLFYSKLDDLHTSTQRTAVSSSTWLKEHEKHVQELHQTRCARWQQYIVNPKQGFDTYLQITIPSNS